MDFAFEGASIDSSAYLSVTGLAQRAPGWLNAAVTAWSVYGLIVFAVFTSTAWWQARRAGRPVTAMTALAVPVITVLAYGVNVAAKLTVHENRPCQSLWVRTLEACPTAGDWSFPSTHAAVAGAVAVGLLFVSRRLGAIACAAAAAMAASRVWIGVHYPHDVLAGLVAGGAVAFACMVVVRRCSSAMARRMTESASLRPLLTAS
ncbi:phosphatase PAP2 family protein [Streptomyces sp. NPDC052040]|uniref:phosphatase PAP2 family protein n=1 Tax=Streptomyces sp. NPDC052040 TaxID=3365682 RepID=UPI0037D42F84